MEVENGTVWIGKVVEVQGSGKPIIPQSRSALRKGEGKGYVVAEGGGSREGDIRRIPTPPNPSALGPARALALWSEGC